jgi:hypothetical protein
MTENSPLHLFFHTMEKSALQPERRPNRSGGLKQEDILWGNEEH